MLTLTLTAVGGKIFSAKFSNDREPRNKQRLFEYIQTVFGSLTDATKKTKTS
jgi:hypothetical protein